MKKMLIVDIDEEALRQEWDRTGSKSLEELIQQEMQMSSEYGIRLESVQDLDDNILHPEQQL